MKNFASRRKGFTLIEILLVVGIIAALATITVVVMWPAREEANLDLAKIKIEKIMASLERYANKMSYPSTEDGLNALIEAPSDSDVSDKWAGPYLSSGDLKDPWGSDMIYRLDSVELGNKTRQVPHVYSVGPNKTDDNGEGDDIKNNAWASSTNEE